MSHDRKAMQPDSDMLDEYDFSAGARGKYAERYASGTNVVLDPDVAAAFPSERAVNEALREQMLLKKQQPG